MTRRRNLGVVGAVLVVAGAIALATSFTRHEACSSIIGQIAQGVSTRAQIMCGEYTAAFYAGIAGIIAGIVLVIVAWAIRPATPGRHASPFPAGWYLDEDDKNLRRWWDGEGWTDYTKPDRKPVWLHVVNRPGFVGGSVVWLRAARIGGTPSGIVPYVDPRREDGRRCSQAPRSPSATGSEQCGHEPPGPIRRQNRLQSSQRRVPR